MLYSNKNREESETLNELVSLNNQVDDLRLQDKLGEQNFHENTKKIEPFTDTIKNPFQYVTKTLTEISIKNNQAIENLNDKLLEMMKYRGIITSYLLPPLSKKKS